MLSLLLLGVIAAAPTDQDSSQAADFFPSEVQPILEKNCLRCHGERRSRGGLRLDSRSRLLQGGDRGAAFSSEAPSASLLLKMISYADEDHQMPPSGKLADEQIEVLRRWIEAGAPYGVDEAEPEEPEEEAEGEAAVPWRYQTLQRPPLPAASADPWIRQPLDAFILDRLQQQQLPPTSAAERRTLLRRAYYDLLGLPPSPEEVDAFLSDPDENAYEQLIDRLLDSPHYGEKWGRHWLDLVRYAETNGYERDTDKPFMWRYRDYVIDSFNADKPYDQFTLEQLAGDELAEVTPDSLTATGYYRLMIWDDEPGAGALEGRYDVLDDIVSTTGQVFLGMTLGCARCHDHKKDPIPQRDYYSMMAFFHGLTDMSVSDCLREVMNAEERSDYEAVLATHNQEKAEAEQALESYSKQLRPRLTWLRDPQAAPASSMVTELSYQVFSDAPGSGTTPSTSGTLPGSVDLAVTPPGSPFRALFEGTLQVPREGALTFRSKCSGKLRLRLGGATILEHDSGLAAAVREQRVSLAQGPIAFALDFHHREGMPSLQLDWDGGDEKAWQSLCQPVPELDLAKAVANADSKVFNADERSTFQELKGRVEVLQRKHLPRKMAMAAAEKGREAAPLHVHIRGNPHVLGDLVEPAFPSALGPATATIPTPSESATSSGRRLALARWIASADNPMTARVLANRLWQYHFGRGLVPTANDFGALGIPATHPELLDWLAAEVVAGGWRLKRMHRRIMTSATYRMSSRAHTEGLERDPANDLFWRFPPRRLSAEELRDSVLSMTGKLNARRGGPSFFAPVPAEVLATSSRPNSVWGKSPEDETFRRSVYMKVKRSLLPPILSSFDLADTDASCPERFTTTLPTQALTLLQGEFLQRHATDFAERLQQEVGANPSAQVRRALRLALSREPTPDEVSHHLGFLEELRDDHALSAFQALRNFCVVVLNLNEFIYLD